MSENTFIELLSNAFNAGDTKTYALSGTYFEIIDCPNTCDVVLSDRNGAQVCRMNAAEASFNISDVPYDTIQITSATAQTIRIARGSGRAGTRRAAGSVAIANKRGPFTHNTRTVTNVSGQLQAANANRSYLLIQNKSATGNVYLNMAGSTATLADGILIEPGGSLELSNYLPTNLISAIGDIASNPSVIVVEG